MKTFAPFFEIFEAATLALREKALVHFTCKEGEACIGIRTMSGKVRWQIVGAFIRKKTPIAHAAGNLLEERYGNFGELLLQPVMRFIVQVFVSPEDQEEFTRAVQLLADHWGLNSTSDVIIESVKRSAANALS